MTFEPFFFFFVWISLYCLISPTFWPDCLTYILTLVADVTYSLYGSDHPLLHTSHTDRGASARVLDLQPYAMDARTDNLIHSLIVCHRLSLVSRLRSAAENELSPLTFRATPTPRAAWGEPRN